MGVSANLAESVSALNNLVTSQYAFRNRIINGACNIAQRVSFVATAGLSGYGGPDRFVATNSVSAGGQFTQGIGTITYNGLTHNAVVQAVNTAIVSASGTNFWDGIQQIIEGWNCYDLVGQAVTISFVFYTNVTGTYSVALRNSVSSTSYVATFTASANVPQKVIVNIPLLPASFSFVGSNAAGMSLAIGAINTGTYQTSTPNTFASGNFITAAGSTNWGLTAGNFIALTEMQLEPGVEATPFEVRQFNTELTLCQRYYQTIYANARFYAMAAGQYFNSNLSWQRMRTTPTATYLGGGASTLNLASTPGLAVPGTNSGRFEIVSAAAGDCYAVTYEYGLSAEL